MPGLRALRERMRSSFVARKARRKAWRFAGSIRIACTWTQGEATRPRRICAFPDLLVRPRLGSFKTYLFRGGLFEGWRGLLLAGLYACYTFEEDAKLCERMVGQWGYCGLTCSRIATGEVPEASCRAECSLSPEQGHVWPEVSGALGAPRGLDGLPGAN